MGIYVLTGGATGIGAATRQSLEKAGHRVFMIDLHQGDIQADLSDASQRQQAINAIIDQYPEGIDGFIPCAGLGPHVKPHALITQVNFFAVTQMVTALKPLIAKRQGAIVLVSSSSASMPGLNKDYIHALLNNDEATACTLINTLDGHNAYAGSKYALTTWMRSQNAQFAAEGIRMNAVAPGITQTPLTHQVMNDKELGTVMKAFGDSVPIGRLGQPQDIANVICFLLSDQAAFISGSVIFIDGGHDALLRNKHF